MNKINRIISINPSYIGKLSLNRTKFISAIFVSLLILSLNPSPLSDFTRSFNNVSAVPNNGPSITTTPTDPTVINSGSNTDLTWQATGTPPAGGFNGYIINKVTGSGGLTYQAQSALDASSYFSITSSPSRSGNSLKLSSGGIGGHDWASFWPDIPEQGYMTSVEMEMWAYGQSSSSTDPSFFFGDMNVRGMVPVNGYWLRCAASNFEVTRYDDTSAGGMYSPSTGGGCTSNTWWHLKVQVNSTTITIWKTTSATFGNPIWTLDISSDPIQYWGFAGFGGRRYQSSTSYPVYFDEVYITPNAGSSTYYNMDSKPIQTTTIVKRGVWASATDVTYNTGTLTQNTDYEAVFIGGEGRTGAIDTVSVKINSVPNAPTSLTATPGDKQVTLNWVSGGDGGSPNTGYKIYRDGTDHASVAAGITTFTDTGLTNGLSYSYQVSAINTIGEGAKSTSASATPVSPSTVPNAPTTLSATPGDQQTTLNWVSGGDGGSPITGYKIYRDGIDHDSVAAGITMYTDTGLTNGLSYSYQVSAINTVGEGPKSTSASATPVTAPDNSPSITTTPNDPTVINSGSNTDLTWQATGTPPAGGFNGYIINKVTGSGGLTYQAQSALDASSYFSMTSSPSRSGNSLKLSSGGIGGHDWASFWPDIPEQGYMTSVVMEMWAYGQSSSSTDPSFFFGDMNVRGMVPVNGYWLRCAASNFEVTRYDDTSAGEMYSPSTGGGCTSNTWWHLKVQITNTTITIWKTTSATFGNPIWTLDISSDPIQYWGFAGFGGRRYQSSTSYPVYFDDVYITPNGGSSTYYDMDSKPIQTTTVVEKGVWASTTNVTYNTGTLTQNTDYEAVFIGNEGRTGVIDTVSVEIIDVPNALTSLSATIGDKQATLNWVSGGDGGSPITGFNIYRDGTKMASVGGEVTTYTDFSLFNGVTYIFNVSAVNAVGEGPKSTTISVTPLGLPSAPLNLGTASGDKQVILYWTYGSNGGSSINEHKIYRDGIFLTSVAGEVNTHTDTGLTNGLSYSYQVSAVNAIGEGSKSTAVSATPVSPSTVPNAPTDLTATSGDQQVTLSWSSGGDGGSPITLYKIYRDDAFIANVTGVTFTDTGLTNGLSYSYQVSTVNAIGEGAKSTSVSATPESSVTVPDAPTDLNTFVSDLQVVLTWSSGNDGGSTIIGYKIYRDGSEIDQIDSDTTSYTDQDVNAGQSYSYQVSAVNDIGEGAKSSSVSVTLDTEETNTPVAPFSTISFIIALSSLVVLINIRNKTKEK